MKGLKKNDPHTKLPDHSSPTFKNKMIVFSTPSTFTST